MCIIRSNPTYIRKPFYNYDVWHVVYIILIFAVIVRVPRKCITVNRNLLRDCATLIIETNIDPHELSLVEFLSQTTLMDLLREKSQ